MYLASAVKVFVCVLLTLGGVASSSEKLPLTLFLIGKTGHGKSSTGNSLLGRTAFEVSDSAESVTNEVQIATGSIQGRSLQVIDGPGVLDTRLDSVDAIRKTTDDMRSAISSREGGIDAFLIVLKYGNRFTAEEKSTIDSLKSILGDNFISDHSVIVFTHGEMFELNHQKSGPSFESWFSQQTGPLKDLIQEVSGRCTLAFNVDTDKMNLDLIISQVAGLVDRKGRYTIDMYDSMEHSRQQLIVRTDADRLQTVMNTDITCKTDQLSNIQTSGETHDTKLSKLATLKDDVMDLKQRITMSDMGTGVLETQKEACDRLLANVGSQEGVVRQAKANEEEQRRLEAIRAEAQRLQEQAEQVRRKRKKKPFWGLF